MPRPKRSLAHRSALIALSLVRSTATANALADMRWPPRMVIAAQGLNMRGRSATVQHFRWLSARQTSLSLIVFGYVEISLSHRPLRLVEALFGGTVRELAVGVALNLVLAAPALATDPVMATKAPPPAASTGYVTGLGYIWAAISARRWEARAGHQRLVRTARSISPTPIISKLATGAIWSACRSVTTL